MPVYIALQYTIKGAKSMGRERSIQALHTRQGFLHGAAGLGVGLTAASFTSIFGVGAFGAIVEASRSPTDDVATILNLATTAEMLAVTFYDAVRTKATFHMEESAAQSLVVVMNAEKYHLQMLRSLGGRLLQSQFYLPAGLLSNARVFASAGLATETAFANAYLAAAQRLAVLGKPTLAATAARLGASEAQHLTLLSYLAGLTPNDLTLPAQGLRDIEDAMPSLALYLHGGAGFVGPVRGPSDL